MKKVLSKYTFLGIINILLAMFFLYFFSMETLGSINNTKDMSGRLINIVLQIIIISFSAFLNAFSARQTLLRKKDDKPFIFYFFITISTILWFFLYFVGYFFASNVFFPIVSLSICIVLFLFFKKFSIKIASIMCFVTIASATLNILFAFEEDYCWKKGEAADPKGSTMIIATKKDAEALTSEGFPVTEGSEIGLSFKTHMLCHDTFSLSSGLKEKYLFLK